MSRRTAAAGDGNTLEKSPGDLRAFLRALAAHRPRRLALLLVLQVGAALAQGAGLLLLLPLLQEAGVNRQAVYSGLTRDVRSVLHAFGAPFSLGSILCVYVVVVALAAGLSMWATVAQTRYRWELSDGLRRRLYAAIATAEWRQLVALRQSDLLTALTVDANWVNQGVLASLSLVNAAVLIAVQGVVALKISPSVTGLAALTGTGLAVLVWPLVRRSRMLGRQLVEHNRSVLRSVTGFLDGLKLAKVHGREPSHLAGFDTAIANARGSQIEFARASALATALQVSATAVVLALLVGAAVDWFRLAPAGLLVLAFVFFRLVPQITQAQTAVQSVAQSLPAFDELMSTVARCEAAAERPAGSGLFPTASPRRPRIAVATGITLENVSFSYEQPSGRRRDVLHCVTLAIPARCTTALVGPSGAGKTTVADLVTGLLAPTSGRVAVDGATLDRDLARSWREVVAMVPQDPYLFHDTVRANLAWARPGATESEMGAALGRAAARFVESLPQGLDTVVGDRGARLSGGERQRIALARALLREPELLVLDEATNALDATNEALILEALVALGGQLTILVIAHQPATTQSADQVVRIEDGRVTEVSTTLGRMA